LKLALATHTPDVTSRPLVSLLSGSFEQRLSKAKSLGFDGVELMVARPSELRPKEILLLLRSLHLEVAAVASGPVVLQDQLTLLARTKDLMKRAASRLVDLIDMADSLKAPLVTVGSFRGRAEWAGETSARLTLIEVMRLAGERAEGLGVRLVLEPLNRYETDLIGTVNEGLTLIDEIGSPQVGLLLDTFHMNIEEANLFTSIRQAATAGRLWHVHIGDSNRLPPGQGHIDFDGIVGVLTENGYSGWLSAELLASLDPDAAAEATIQYMRPLLRQRENNAR